mmetsp:Transcript_41528/g.101380  ORF Transcript_41528/g.101380 Transcript_41528/m.101380 type:complete len:235 (+) Transcript_41528:391-1095(+)
MMSKNKANGRSTEASTGAERATHLPRRATCCQCLGMTNQGESHTHTMPIQPSQRHPGMEGAPLSRTTVMFPRRLHGEVRPPGRGGAPLSRTTAMLPHGAARRQGRGGAPLCRTTVKLQQRLHGEARRRGKSTDKTTMGTSIRTLRSRKISPRQWLSTAILTMTKVTIQAGAITAGTTSIQTTTVLSLLAGATTIARINSHVAVGGVVCDRLVGLLQAASARCANSSYSFFNKQL